MNGHADHQRRIPAGSDARADQIDVPGEHRLHDAPTHNDESQGATDANLVSAYVPVTDRVSRAPARSRSDQGARVVARPSRKTRRELLHATGADHVQNGTDWF